MQNDRMMQRWPEHRKLEALGGKNETIGQFIEWLEAQELVIAKAHTHADECDPPRNVESFQGRVCGMFEGSNGIVYRWSPSGGSGSYIQRIIALYFGIDADVLEREKQEMLWEVPRHDEHG